MQKVKEVKKGREVYWHALSGQKAIEELKSSEKGLKDSQASERLRIYGKNAIRKINRLEPIKILFEQFKSFFVILLIIAAVISGLLSMWIDMYVIAAIIIINASIGFTQNYRAERTIKALKGMMIAKAKVLRGNVLKELNISEIVPGDILVLQEGDKIAADARILETQNMQVNEAVLTGESTPVIKLTKTLEVETPIYGRYNLLFNGTSLVSGSGKAVVVATGMNTEFGKIARLVQETRPEKTPLQVKLDSFAKKLGLIIIAISLLIVIIGISFGFDKMQIFLTAISLAVAAAPEGLPAIITICLAFAIQRMKKANSLIRKLPAAETFGRVTVICTDKTGTITEEEMQVTDIFVDNKIIKAKNLLEKKAEKNKALKLLLKINCLCSNARVEEIKEDKKEKEKARKEKADKEKEMHRIFIGDPTEKAILKIATELGFDKKTLTEEEPRVKEFSFSSTRKMMSVIRKTNGGIVSYIKGAPDTVIDRCSKELIGSHAVKLSAIRKKELLRVYNEMAAKGLRVLGFAYKDLGKETKKKVSQKEAESELVFIGLEGMLDPPRKEVRKAIEQAMKAGISIKMITGDSLLTAKAVAEQINLKGEALEGKETEKMSDEDLLSRMKDTVIFARVTPEHKLRIVNLLKKQGEIVAVTGDGVNDAPALKRADIGVAMGIRGTEVAREASDIILLDDNFASIIESVREGRRAYSNIRKAVKFLIAANFSEIGVILFSIMATLPLPLLPLHILWINLITDSAPALALSNEPAEKGIMEEKPKPRQAILHGMFTFILLAGIVGFIATITAFFLFMPDLPKARTAALTTIVFFELFFVFTCRTDKPVQEIGFFSNRYILLAIIISVIIHLIAIYSPLSTALNIAPLALRDWPKIIGLSLGGLVLFEIGKNIKKFSKKH